MNRTRFAANLISALLNPLWIGLVFFIWFVLVLKPEKAVLIMLSGVLSTVVVPLLIVFTMVRLGRAENIDVPDRQKRLIPFALFVIEYGIFVGINYLLDLPQEFQAVMWVVLINTVIYALITVWWKVSIHAAGVTGYVTCLAWFGGPVIWMVLPPLLVAWSRIYLKAHSPAQVTAGTILGFVLTWYQLGWYLPGFH